MSEKEERVAKVQEMLGKLEARDERKWEKLKEGTKKAEIAVPDPKPVVSAPIGERVLKVVRLGFNPRMVEGVDGESAPVPVYVGRNVNLAVGDLLVCEEMAGQEGIWEFARMKDERIPTDHLGLPRDKRRPW